MANIEGTWSIKVGILTGFTYTFLENGNFQGEFPTYNVKFSGTYQVDESKSPHLIDLEVMEHNQGDLGKGLIQGIFEIEDNILKMKLNEPNKGRWTDTSAYVYYEKIS